MIFSNNENNSTFICICITIAFENPLVLRKGEMTEIRKMCFFNSLLDLFLRYQLAIKMPWEWSRILGHLCRSLERLLPCWFTSSSGKS